MGKLLLRLCCYALGLLLVASGLGMFLGAMLNHAYTPDLPWILRSGQHILAHMQLPTHDIFSWTMSDKSWVLYQWLFEVVVAWAHQWLGEQTLLRVFIMLVIALYMVLPLWDADRRKIPVLIPLVVSTLALMTISVNISLRPMIMTTLFLAIQYLVLRWYRQHPGNWKALLWILLPLYILWGNLHTGVILGLFSLGLMALGDALERRGWYPRESAVPELDGWPAHWRVYAMLALCGFLASLINPYGIGIYSYLANLSSQQYLNDVIHELKSPNFHWSAYHAFLVLFATFILLMPRYRQAFSAHEMIHLLAFSLIMLFVQRFVVWTCLFYVLMLPKALYVVWIEISRTKPFLQQTVAGFNVFRYTVYGAIVLGAFGFLLVPKTLGVPAAEHGMCEPLRKGIAAYQQLKLPTDKLLNDPQVGSCILAQLPDTKVFIDTRFDFYGQKHLYQQRQALLVGKRWQAYLDKWRVNTLMMSKQWPLMRLLMEDARYEKLYEDKAILILRRKSN